MEVLVLGNGASRLRHDKMIRSWVGEVWGCNRVYLDYGPILTRIATDNIEMLHELHAYRAESGARFETWAWGAVARAGADRRFTSPGSLRANSGAMLAMQGAEEGHDVTLLGFDMGGEDVYLGDLGDKPGWIGKWRRVADHYGADRFRFIGVDIVDLLARQGERNMKKVRYPNGYEAEYSDEIAKRVVEKKQAEYVSDHKAAPKAEEPKRSRPAKSKDSGNDES